MGSREQRNSREDLHTSRPGGVAGAGWHVCTHARAKAAIAVLERGGRPSGSAPAQPRLFLAHLTPMQPAAPPPTSATPALTRPPTARGPHHTQYTPCLVTVIDARTRRILSQNAASRAAYGSHALDMEAPAGRLGGDTARGSDDVSGPSSQGQQDARQANGGHPSHLAPGAPTHVPGGPAARPPQGSSFDLLGELLRGQLGEVGAPHQEV